MGRDEGVYSFRKEGLNQDLLVVFFLQCFVFYRKPFEVFRKLCPFQTLIIFI